MKWRVVWTIAQKDIVEAVKNRYLFFSLILPIGLSLLFSVAFRVPEDLGVFKVAVYDPGGSRLVAALRGLSDVQVQEVDSAGALPEVVKKGAVAGLAVPAGFDAAVQVGEKPELAVCLNYRQGGGKVAAFQRLLERQVWALAGQDFPVRIVSTDVAAPATAADEQRTQRDRYFLIVLLVLALATTGAFVVPQLLVEEKEKHTLQALLVSPAGPAEVAVGKVITGMVYSLLVAAVLVALNRGWEGNWPLTLLGIVLGALLTISAGLLMGSLARTTAQVNTWSSVVMIALTVPSWFVLIDVPASIQTVVRLIPTHYLCDLFHRAVFGEASLGRVAADLVVLAGSTLALLLLVVWRLRREEA